MGVKLLLGFTDRRDEGSFDPAEFPLATFFSGAAADQNDDDLDCVMTPNGLVNCDSMEETREACSSK